ncbi:MAG TPA: translocation/assembly module TamB domain-containing protein, partial [Candidatus Acidoferrales bacterium]|nr:translocation/assembly module TamB domain-containing protein [Candidatus Acidoferrales bacterium]
ARGGWKDDQLFVDEASVAGEGIEGVGHGSPEGLNAKVDFDPSLLGVVVDELALVGGHASVEGVLRGSMANPLVDAQLQIHDGTLAGRLLGDLQARFHRQGPRLEFNDFTLRGADGELSGNVDITVRHEVPINGAVVCKNIDLQKVLADAGAAVPFGLRLNGDIALHGAFDPLDLGINGNGQTSAVSQTEKPIADWQASTRVAPHRVSIDAKLTQSEGNQATASIAIDKGVFSGEALLAAKDLRPLNALLPTPVGSLAMSGQADAKVTFGASAEHPALHAELTTQDLTVMGSRVPRLGGSIDVARGVLKASSVRVESTNGSLDLAGAVALNSENENDATFTLRNFDTDLFVSFVQSAVGSRLPLNSGFVDGSARLQGKWSRLTAQAILTAKSPRLWSEPLQQIMLSGDVSGNHWRAKLNAVHTGTESLTVDGEGDGNASSQIKVASTPVDLARLLGAGKRGLAGSVVVQGQLSGAAAQLGGHLELSGKDLTIQERSIGDLQVRFDGARGNWQFATDAFYDSLNLRGNFSLLSAKAYSLNGKWAQTELGALIGVDPELRLWSSGNLALNGSLATPAAVSGTIEISTLDLSRDAYHLSAERPIRLRVDHGRVGIEAFDLIAEESHITARGSFTVDGLFDVQAEGAGDMVLLELIGPPVQAARGPFSISASLRHEAGGNWKIAGTATLHSGTFDFGLPVAFTRVEAALRSVGTTVYVDDLSGRAGGGAFNVAGSIDLVRGPNLTWSLDGVSFSASRGFEARLQGKGEVRGAWSNVVVSGGVEVLNALYDRDIGLGDLLDWLRQQLVAMPRGHTASASAVAFDLKIYSDGGVFLDNNVAKGEMWVNLYLGGNAAKPALTGTIGILDGEVNFHGRKFTVTGGSIDFWDPNKINPSLNIAAESRISTTDTDYVVNVTVTGTADKPRILFNADDPSLSQNDVLSLVAFGKTTAQLQRDSTGGVNPASALAIVPTSAVTTPVGQFVGVDQFEVTAAQARDTGAIEPRVTIGKDLTEQLRAVVWTEFGIVARHAVQLEYRVTRRVSLLGSWESETSEGSGAFGGDIKFRFDFRRIPFSLRDTPPAESASSAEHP